MPDPTADRYAVFGNPVKHSWSPLIHAAFAEQCEQSMVYDATEIAHEAFEPSVLDFFASGGSGLNITLPFKARAYSLCDVHSQRALEAGACNTLYLRDGLLHGENTDGTGLVSDLTLRLGGQLAGARILLLGAGGAVSGVLGALSRARPAEIHIANRTAEKARRLAEQFRQVGRIQGTGFEELADAGRFDWVINGTSASLGGQAPAIPPECLRADTACYDMVYGAEPTAFMRWCENQGANRVYDGLGMLVGQAAESFSIWRGVMPDPEPVIAMLRERLA